MKYNEDKRVWWSHNSDLICFNSLELSCVQESSFVNRLPCDFEERWEIPNQLFTFNLIILMESYTESNTSYQSTLPTSLLWKNSSQLFFHPSFITVFLLWLSWDQPSFQRAVGIQSTFIFGGQSNWMYFPCDRAHH